MAETAGLAQLRSALEASAESGTGIGPLLGMTVETLEPGRTVFGLNTGPQHGNPIGSVHGGVLSTLLDSAMSCAVHTALPEGAGYTTLELKVNFVRPARTDGGPLRCEGTTIHLGRRVATCEGRITDANGKLVAHGTATCMIFGPNTVQ
jgi:uncharacterized protein (TIGR00369 family)